MMASERRTHAAHEPLGLVPSPASTPRGGGCGAGTGWLGAPRGRGLAGRRRTCGRRDPGAGGGAPGSARRPAERRPGATGSRRQRRAHTPAVHTGGRLRPEPPSPPCRVRDTQPRPEEPVLLPVPAFVGGQVTSQPRSFSRPAHALGAPGSEWAGRRSRGCRGLLASPGAGGRSLRRGVACRHLRG